MTDIIREEPEPLPADVPAPLRWVVERLLSKEPAERYDSTRDVYRELKQFRERFSQATSVADAPDAPAARRPKRGLAVALVAIAVIAASLATAYLVSAPAPDFLRVQVHASRAGGNRRARLGMVSRWQKHRVHGKGTRDATGLRAEHRFTG